MREFISAIVLSLGGDDGVFESEIICSDRALSDASIFTWVHASMVSSVDSKFVRFVLSDSCNVLLMFLALSARTDEVLPAETPGESEDEDDDDDDDDDDDESDESDESDEPEPNENPSRRRRTEAALVTT